MSSQKVKRIYDDWGFRGDPFDVSALASNPDGNDLLVGRSDEVDRFLKRIKSTNKIVTLEGNSGIGKTSIANVAIYRASLDFLERRNSGYNSEFYFPCVKNFQIETNNITEKVRLQIFLAIAQTIIEYKDDFKALRIPLPAEINELKKWISQPNGKGIGASLGAATIQIGGSISSQPSESIGFEQGGFQAIVSNWLSFVNQKYGGSIVCIIDNLELLKTSSDARNVLEHFRDDFFSMKGIRWVVCGSFGIVSSVLSSPRLEGYFYNPLQINGLTEECIEELLTKRIKKYSLDPLNYYLPLTNSSFIQLYNLLGQNIRATLRYAGEFCLWISDKKVFPITENEKNSFFADWFFETVGEYEVQISKNLDEHDIELLKFIIKLDGVMSSKAYKNSPITSFLNFKRSIHCLEDMGLVQRLFNGLKDEKTFSITVLPKALFVYSQVINNYTKTPI